jgi:hypothetical protein
MLTLARDQLARLLELEPRLRAALEAVGAGRESPPVAV